MKKYLHLIFAWIMLIEFNQDAKAATFTSNSAGPVAWNVNTSWTVVGVDADGIPDSDDDVTISLGHTITNNVTSACRDLTVAGTLSLGASAYLSIYGNYDVSGTESGTSTSAIVFSSGTGTTISGAGSFSTVVKWGFIANRTISSNVTVNKTSTLTIAATITNLGSFEARSATTYASAVIINSTNATLTIDNALFMSGRTITATATGNTVVINYTSNAVVATTGNAFYNLTIAKTPVTLRASTTVANNLTINSSSSLDATASNYDLSVGGNWINNGTFTPRSATVTFNGTSTISGTFVTSFNNLTISGALTAPASANMNVAGNWVNNGTFTHNSGTVTFNGTSTVSGSAATSFRNLTISGTLTGHSTNMNVAGNWINNGTFTHNSGTVTFNGTTTISGSSTNSFSGVTISGTLTAPSGNINVAGNWANNGTFTHSSGTVTFNGTSTVSGSAATSFRNVTISGTLTGHSTNMNVAGNWINNGTFTHNSGTVTFNGTTPITGSATNSFSGVTISGTLTAPATANMNVAGNWANNGTFTHNSCTLTFNGTTTVSGSSTTSLNNVTISGTLTGHSTNMNVTGSWVNNGTFTHNNGTVTFNGTTTISGSATNSFKNITISGTLTGPASANMNVAGNWTNNGTFTHNSGTVTFNGTTAMSGSATNSMNNITISGTLTAPSSNMNIAGNLTNNGTYTHNSGTTTFNGTTTVSGSSTTTLNNVTISGTLTAHSSSMGINGNFINDGTFNANGGSVTFGTTTVSGNSTTTFNNIQINTSLTGHSNILNLTGNMINPGTYIGNGGILNFNGSTAQTISGGGTGTFENLGLNNSNGLTVTTGTYTLPGTIYITAGTLTNFGTFTLSADATRYARIDEISAFCGSCGFSGNFNIQRYLPSRTTGVAWANLSSPVSNATMADWDANLYLVYPFTGFDTEINRPTGSNVMAYDEPSANYTECSAATNLSAGMGFEIALTDDETVSSFSATTITTTGTPNYGSYDIPLSFTGANGPAYPTGYSGENLIGNPFASAIDFSLITITNALPSVDVYDYETNSYKTLSGSDLIGPHQGFWAYAQGTGASVTIPESAKSTSTTTDIERVNKAKGENQYLNLTISTVDETDYMSHTLKVACNATALDGWDNSDHPFRKSLDKQAPSITANAEKAIVSINTFNSNHETYVMPLQVKVGIDGRYRIRAANLSTITNDFAVVLLEDRITKTFIDLTNSSEYMFSAKTGDAKDRFVLHFSKLANYTPAATTIANASNEIQISQSKEGNVIYFNNSEVQNTTITVMDLLGKRIIGDISVEALNQTVNISLPEGFHGMYIISVKSANNTTVKKFNSFQ